jgi:CheY-like chemotaxis protein
MNKKQRVLVVEEVLSDRLLARLVLEKNGYSVRCVTSGNAALEALGEECFDLVVTGIRLPDINGMELTRRIRAGIAKASCAEIPIIAVTASTLQGDKERILASGVDDYLAKPIDLNNFVSTVTRFCPPPLEA